MLQQFGLLNRVIVVPAKVAVAPAQRFRPACNASVETLDQELESYEQWAVLTALRESAGSSRSSEQLRDAPSLKKVRDLNSILLDLLGRGLVVARPGFIGSASMGRLVAADVHDLR